MCYICLNVALMFCTFKICYIYLNCRKKILLNVQTSVKSVSFNHVKMLQDHFLKETRFRICIDWVLNGSWAKYLLDLLPSPIQT